MIGLDTRQVRSILDAHKNGGQYIYYAFSEQTVWIDGSDPDIKKKLKDGFKLGWVWIQASLGRKINSKHGIRYECNINFKLDSNTGEERRVYIVGFKETPDGILYTGKEWNLLKIIQK